MIKKSFYLYELTRPILLYITGGLGFFVVVL